MNYSFLFPGQGSQSVGMGQDLYNSYDRARSRFEQANALLGRDIVSLIFSGPMERLTATENTQPALFVVEAAITDVLKENQIVPVVTAGHSLGEYGALYAAGVLSFEDGLRAVTRRGMLMAEAGKASAGTMAAVIGMNKETLAATLTQVKSGIVVTANENSPDQTVISGEVTAVREACEKCKAAGAKRAILLPVGGAFHSPLMQSAADAFAGFLDTISFKAPSCPVISNVSAALETDPVRIKDLLLHQLTSPVRWIDSMMTLAALKHGHCLETGPKDVLKGLAKKCNYSLNVISCGSAMNIYSLLAEKQLPL
ncbi:MAG: ACP S-malonyltransferase [Chitinispirillaceae bacterium]|nr:ACP S-malonyltransferase [Chitinispirillaceae bacterium]